MDKVRLGDICTIYDGPHATPKKTTHGPIYLGIDALTPDGKINESEYAHLSENDFDIWSKRVVPQGRDIVFSYEATLGRYALIPDGFHGCLGRRLGILRADESKVVPEWLYYFLRSPEWTQFMENHTYRGSTVNRYSVEDMPDYLIPLPCLKHQIRVKDVLLSIDAKIDNNKKLIAELEETARLIYDYWFTQFDFPDENGKPYRSSGGKMVWSEELKREIPVGWQDGRMSDLAEITMGQSPSGDSYNLDGMGTVFYQGKVDFGDFFPTVRTYTTAATRMAERGDVLLSVRAPVGDTNFAYEDCCIGRGLAALHCKAGSPLYIRFTLEGFSDVFDRMNGSGTTFGAIDKAGLNGLKVPVPPVAILKLFESRVESCYKEIVVIESEARNLIKLRDWLLPMLMSGQVKVAN